MAYNSMNFFLFVLFVILVYFVLPKKLQWIVLLVASYVFYLISAKVLVVFLLFTTITTFYTGILLGKANDQYTQVLANIGSSITKEQKQENSRKNKKKKWLILLLSLLLNFGILAFMKYFDFFAINITSILSLLSINAKIPTLNLLLPLGISFYTFQSTGYIIDIYRGKNQPDKNIAKFALFVSFFPQIVQGPISRYDQLAFQLYEPHQFDYTRVKFGAQLILWGLFKKMVIADRAAVIVDFVFNHHRDYEGFTIFFGVMLYTVQVYCDFSGGIDIARGVAQILGINLTSNFERPLFATSIADFWRRWHITLSTWMRDYIFYPLSLSKAFNNIGKISRKVLGNYLGKLLPTFLAMLITFLTVGIWHGASWKFVAYGLYNGILIFSGILFEPLIVYLTTKLHINSRSFGWRIFQILSTFLLVCIGRYFSRAPSFMIAVQMLKLTFVSFNINNVLNGSLLHLGLDEKDLWVLLAAILVLFIIGVLQEYGYSLRRKISEQNLVFRWSFYMAAIFSIIIFGFYGQGYHSTNFIYMGF